MNMVVVGVIMACYVYDSHFPLNYEIIKTGESCLNYIYI